MGTLVLGIISLAIGLVLLYWIGRRRFYRRSAFGSEGFSGYNRSLAVPFLERIGKIIGYVLILFGVLFILAYYHTKKGGAKASQTQQSKY